ncbi:MAG: hypothetical protein F6K23_14725 [Okeania sp. SIO2C9]|uniref:hypothetical protein n=1 Tax=Okeania sp. SIO2C9 TaxID=2607791 RepID=UPI0013C220CD|nr:hypothetical protein [Okeania sp. SIO2C9]NEQ74178.1 hypothetical protein [Okeania sp. SIO2C9]
MLLNDALNIRTYINLLLLFTTDRTTERFKTIQSYNTSYEKQNLAEAAAEIQELLEQLSQTYPTTTEKEQIELAVEAADEIQKNPTLKSRLIIALTAGGMEALKESIKHPLSSITVNVLAAYLQEWQKSTTESVED